MNKLFDDRLLVQKERPNKITKQQEEQMFVDLSKEIIENQYSSDDEETIAEDLADLSIYDNGFEKAKYLDDRGSADYTFEGDFIDWLDNMEYKRRSILTENIKLWVEAHNILPIHKVGTELLITNDISHDKTLRKECIIFINGYNEKEATYKVSNKKEDTRNFIIEYERVESNCVIPTLVSEARSENS
jgi:hypothetical protein